MVPVARPSNIGITQIIEEYAPILIDRAQPDDLFPLGRISPPHCRAATTFIDPYAPTVEERRAQRPQISWSTTSPTYPNYINYKSYFVKLYITPLISSK